jgi:hypothetical protein
MGHIMSADPPVTRYKLTVTVYGNTIHEVDDELGMVANSFAGLDVGPGFDLFPDAAIHEFTVTGGRSTRKLEHTNPEMTPEQYQRDLNAWAAERAYGA